MLFPISPHPGESRASANPPPAVAPKDSQLKPLPPGRGRAMSPPPHRPASTPLWWPDTRAPPGHPHPRQSALQPPGLPLSPSTLWARALPCSWSLHPGHRCPPPPPQCSPAHLSVLCRLVCPPLDLFLPPRSSPSTHVSAWVCLLRSLSGAPLKLLLNHTTQSPALLHSLLFQNTVFTRLSDFVSLTRM